MEVIICYVEGKKSYIVYDPFNAVCESGDYEVVETLLKKGANPNIYRKGHWTPIEILYVREIEYRNNIAKLLIDYGADVNIVAIRSYPIFSEIERINFYSGEEII